MSRFSIYSSVVIGLFILTNWAGVNCCCAQRTDFFNIDFRKADSVAALYPRHPLKDLKELAEKLTAPFGTDVEKFRAIFQWVTHNIDYDVELYLKDIAKKREYKSKPAKLKQWKKTFSKQVFGHMLTQYKTVCAGYAQLLDELCTHAGLSSAVISGVGRNAIADAITSQSNHAWNSVKLDGRWYLCDATWAAGSVDLDVKRLEETTPIVTFLPRHNTSSVTIILQTVRGHCFCTNQHAPNFFNSQSSTVVPYPFNSTASRQIQAM